MSRGISHSIKHRPCTEGYTLITSPLTSHCTDENTLQNNTIILCDSTTCCAQSFFAHVVYSVQIPQNKFPELDRTGFSKRSIHANKVFHKVFIIFFTCKKRASGPVQTQMNEVGYVPNIFFFFIETENTNKA